MYGIYPIYYSILDNIYMHNIYIYIYIYNCLCVSVAKASDTHAVGYGFDPRPDHSLIYKMGLKIIFRSDLI